MENYIDNKRNTQKHHGQVMEKAVRRSNISLAEVARKAGISRRTLYNWFLQEKLPNVIISKVEFVLNADFSTEIPDYIPVRPAEHSFGAGAYTPLDELRTKYIDLLEKYNALIREFSASDRELTKNLPLIRMNESGSMGKFY
ncbi:helix-turn-helix domain-containing protein [Desertivirga xinjiangensis]|uniref:helix-turn-helix domain-containing protein n=1 Tax=Desertivirga xinjiangensis TaxID=539206 RepID=UPI00210A4AA2|nr:hypothetical protein [Pedobacter xinjiangensis]